MANPVGLDRLKKFESNGAVWIQEENCIHVSSPHLLTQISGYAKFVSSHHGRAVYYRGQTGLYDEMLASLYRIKTAHGRKAIQNRHAILKNYVEQIWECGAMLRGTPQHTVEPLLQHYGVATRWLDIVDNIWIALWFACFNAKISGTNGRFINFERRSISEKGYAYVILFGFEDLVAIKNQPGYWQNDTVEAVDLRLAAPSTYVRPHAQTGLLFRKKDVNVPHDADCGSFQFGIIRVDLADALAWLGTGDLLSAHTIFPPPFYDHGYRRLLEIAPVAHENLGGITMVGT